MSLWNFTQDVKYDLVGHKWIKYGPPIHYASSYDYRFDTIDGRIAINTECTLPYRMRELPDTVCLVLNYVYRDNDDLDGDVLSLGFFGTLLFGDDGTLQLGGGTDTTYQTKLTYKLLTHRDKVDNVTVIYSIYGLPYKGEESILYAQSLSTCGKQYQNYRYIDRTSTLPMFRLGRN